MTRKPKTKRINLRKASEKAYQQVLVTTDDHGKLPQIAERINRAHPGNGVNKIADVLRFCIEAGEKALTAQGV